VQVNVAIYGYWLPMSRGGLVATVPTNSHQDSPNRKKRVTTEAEEDEDVFHKDSVRMNLAQRQLRSTTPSETGSVDDDASSNSSWTMETSNTGGTEDFGDTASQMSQESRTESRVSARSWRSSSTVTSNRSREISAVGAAGNKAVHWSSKQQKKSLAEKAIQALEVDTTEHQSSQSQSPTESTTFSPLEDTAQSVLQQVPVEEQFITLPDGTQHPITGVLSYPPSSNSSGASTVESETGESKMEEIVKADDGAEVASDAIQPDHDDGDTVTKRVTFPYPTNCAEFWDFVDADRYFAPFDWDNFDVELLKLRGNRSLY
jgi:hypothetical protein